MANRRMFSKKITDTDTFLDMPLSAQALYFHLNMHADDDGFLGNAKTILRMVGASNDDFKLLIAKQFVIVFEDGITVIKDWRIHNYIQKDRYRSTIYSRHKKELKVDENQSYQRIQPMDPLCIHDVYKVDTQVRLGKDRLEIGKDSKEEDEEGRTKVLDLYEKNVGVLSPLIIEKINADLDDWMKINSDEYIEIFSLALEFAITLPANNILKYAEKCLDDWEKRNLTTLKSIRAAQERFDKEQRQRHSGYGQRKVVQKEKLPDWAVNPEKVKNSKSQLSEEETKKLQEELKRLGKADVT